MSLVGYGLFIVAHMLVFTIQGRLLVEISILFALLSGV